MKKVVSVLVALLLIGLAVWLWQFYDAKEVTQVPIENDFGSKIVYTTDTTVDTQAYEEHCREIGGMFNECGNICAPDADFCASVCAYTCENIATGEKQVGEEPQGEIGMEDWQDYDNSRYGFSFSYPKNWDAEEYPNDPIGPKINFFPDDEEVPADAIDHFDNVNSVSVFPHGLATEGVFGQAAPFNLETKFAVQESSRLYVLEDGTPFAAYVVPSDPPETWSDAGFIWLRLDIDDLETVCLRDGEKMPVAECDPLTTDDQVIRRGTVNQDIWQKEVDMLADISLYEPIAEKDDLIEVFTPVPGQEISSPLTLDGQARGGWFFEGEFPVILTNWDGLIIAEGTAAAEDDWMTEDYVPFTATLEFQDPYDEGDPSYMQSGNLILERANPSGLPKNDMALEYMVTFAE